MTQQQWRDLRNHLMGLACITCIWTPEYANLNKRIKWIWNNRIK